MATASTSGLPKMAVFSELRSELMWAYDDEVAAQHLRWPIPSTSSSPSTPIVAWLIRTGGVLIRQGSSTMTAKPGTWLFPARAKAAGWQEFVPGTKLLSVRFTTRWLDDRRTLFDHGKAVLFPSAEIPELEHAGAELARIVRAHAGNVQIGLRSRAIDAKAHFAIQARFHDWLSAYSHAMQTAAGLEPKLPQVRNPQAIKALRLVEDHPLSKPLREQEIARRLGVSVSRLNRVFSRHFESTPKRWFDTRRQQYAINALVYSDAQIKSIAFALGFSSLPHFTTWFRRQTGQPPLLFRRLRRPFVPNDPAKG